MKIDECKDKDCTACEDRIKCKQELQDLKQGAEIKRKLAANAIDQLRDYFYEIDDQRFCFDEDGLLMSSADTERIRLLLECIDSSGNLNYEKFYEYQKRYLNKDT